MLLIQRLVIGQLIIGPTKDAGIQTIVSEIVTDPNFRIQWQKLVYFYNPVLRAVEHPPFHNVLSVFELEVTIEVGAFKGAVAWHKVIGGPVDQTAIFENEIGKDIVLIESIGRLSYRGAV